MKTNTSQGHRKRLRDKFNKVGAEGLHDYELIELLLTLGTPRKDRKPQAKEALKKFKALKGVLDAAPEELQKIEGIGPHNSFGIKLVKELASLYLEQKIPAKKVCPSSREVVDYLRHSMEGLKKEVFKVLFLNSQNKILHIEDIFSGTINASAIYPREIIKKALLYDAASLIFAHNHPSGNSQPSESDQTITKELVHAGCMMQVEVLDHLIIGEKEYYSFADKGLMEKYKLKVQHELHI